MTCSASGNTDPNFACSLGSPATINTLQTGGDPPNLVDLSNPLVVEIGPLVGMAPNIQNEGFSALLENLSLVLPSMGTASAPNVAFWDPSDQENSGLRFVGFIGFTSNLSGETGTWIYIGNHAPNSFVSNVHTDLNPANSPPNFYGMILDGRTGFGSAMGTARVVSNSTFTPGRGGGTPRILAGILVTGAHALTTFNQVHVETPSGTDSNFEVTDGASVSVTGPTQFAADGNTTSIVHLTSTGAAITVKNILATTNFGTVQVVKDDVNGVNNLGSFVANYSSSVQAANLQVLKTLTLPNQNATTALLGPSGTFSAMAAPMFRVLTPDDLPAGSGFSYLQDDFYAGANSSGQIGSLGWLFTNSTGASQVGITAIDANHPGILQQKTGATSGNVCTLYLATFSSTNLPLFRLDTTAWHAVFIWALDRNGTYTNVQTTIRLGFGSGTGNPPGDGIYFENASGNTAANWSGVARASNSNTVSGGTIPLDTSFAFHRFEIVNDGSGSNLRFYIDGNLYGSAVTRGLPSASLMPFIQFLNGEAVAKIGDIDYFSFQMEVTR